MNREDFPFFNTSDLIYFDNAASSQTPQLVLDAMNEYYIDYRANIHRGVYDASERASSGYDDVRKQCSEMFDVDNDEIIFTSGSTMGSNMLIMMLENYIKWDSEDSKNKIITTYYEHNSIAIPIIELAKRKNLEIVYIDHETTLSFEMTKTNEKMVYDPVLGQTKKINKIDFKNIEKLSLREKKEKSYEQWSLVLNKYVRLINVTMASNVNGNIFDVGLAVESIEKVCKERGYTRPIIISDMTAMAGHASINLKSMGIDASWCSAHKMCGPTGVGILYIKRDISRMMRPVIYGGGMVHRVESDMSTYRSDVMAFEAGTANIAGVIGMGAAIKYIKHIGIKNIHKYIVDLHAYAYEMMKSLPYIKLYTTESENNIGIISFEIMKNKLENIHPHDIAQVLSDNGIAVRSGHHCAPLYIDYLEANALCRMSLYFYNNKEEIDRFVNALSLVYKKFS